MNRVNALALALLLAATPAAARVQALFVGIDAYPRGADLPRPLKGAVNDVRMIKRALAVTRDLKLDPLLLKDQAGQDCRASNTVSTTLINGCATRAAILAALDSRIAGAAPGDHVLFYYAGHGALTSTTGADTQAGRSSMLVAVDSLGPDGADGILDVELRDRLAAATARGVSVVTIFDACNSGTATRDVRPDSGSRGLGAVRRPDRAQMRPLPPAAPAVLPAPRDDAYLVHMAAAGDDAIAVELAFPDKSAVPPVHGVFSRALDVALRRGAKRSYRAIMADVRAVMSQMGAADAQPIAGDRPLARADWPRPTPDSTTGRQLAAQRAAGEGPLDRGFLGSAPERPVLPVTIAADGATAMLAQGELANVTEGSTYHLFAGSAPGRGARRLTTGVVSRVQAQSAELRLSPAIAARDRAAGAFSAEEIDHRDAPARVRVGLVGNCPVLADSIRKTLATVPAVVLDPDTPTMRLVMAADCAGPLQVQTPQQAVITTIAPGPLLTRQLVVVVRAAARVSGLLALANNGFDDYVEAMWFTGCAEPPCDPMQGGDVVQARVGDGFGIGLEARQPFHAYAFLIDETTLRVTPLGVPENAEDSLWVPRGERAGDVRGKARVLFDGRFQAKGRGKLLLLLSPQPLRAQAWSQAGVRSTDMVGWTALEQALADAGAGTRSVGTPRAADWAGRIISFDIAPALEVSR